MANAFCESDPAANVVPPASISRPSTSLALIKRRSDRDNINDQTDILVLSFIKIDMSELVTFSILGTHRNSRYTEFHYVVLKKTICYINGFFGILPQTE